MSIASEPQKRIALPLRLHEQLSSLGQWMKFLGIVQAVASVGGLFAAAYTAMSLVTAGVPSLAWGVGALGLMLALCFRQALSLLAAADHFVDTSLEVDDAHEHLVLAFDRLRPVFVIDAFVAMAAIVAQLAGGLV